MSLKKSEDNKEQEAMLYEAKALRELQNELDHYLGDGALIVSKDTRQIVEGVGPVLNLI